MENSILSFIQDVVSVPLKGIGWKRASFQKPYYEPILAANFVAVKPTPKLLRHIGNNHLTQTAQTLVLKELCGSQRKNAGFSDLRFATTVYLSLFFTIIGQ